MQAGTASKRIVIEAREFPVLVPDCHSVGMIGVIRSLGEAGYPVHACSHKPDALGLKSNFTRYAHIQPAYADEGYITWLTGVVEKYGIKAIIPSEGFLLAIKDHFDIFFPLLPLAIQSPRIFDFFSKASMTEELLSTKSGSAHIPPSIIVNHGDDLPSEVDIEALGLPVFVKVDPIDGVMERGSEVIKATTARDAKNEIERLIASYKKVLVQGFVPGAGLGAYFLISDGVVLRQFMNNCLHEVPHTGGYCSLRSSCDNPAIMQDAKEKLETLGWNGIAMVEYRWDEKDDSFWFVEINARFWAALHVALYAGVDFPKTLVDVFRGETTTADFQHKAVTLSRHTVPFEIGYVMSVLRDGSLPICTKCQKLGKWFFRFLNPRIRDDLFYPKDRKLYFYQWINFIRDYFKSS